MRDACFSDEAYPLLNHKLICYAYKHGLWGLPSLTFPLPRLNRRTTSSPNVSSATARLNAFSFGYRDVVPLTSRERSAATIARLQEPLLCAHYGYSSII